MANKLGFIKAKGEPSHTRIVETHATKSCIF
jgi:hypothetical protein